MEETGMAAGKACRGIWGEMPAAWTGGVAVGMEKQQGSRFQKIGRVCLELGNGLRREVKSRGGQLAGDTCDPGRRDS